MQRKGKVKFIGIETGMNSLIRPSLYGAYHEIVNLSRLHEEKGRLFTYSWSYLRVWRYSGLRSFVTITMEGDILLIANAGAYGHCMSSNYNLRLLQVDVRIMTLIDSEQRSQATNPRESFIVQAPRDQEKPKS